MARKRKKEGAYTLNLMKGICAIGGAAEKIPDPVGHYLTVKRPFDVFACYKGHLICLEAKYEDAPCAFGPRHLKEHQREALDRFNKAGALCFAAFFTKYQKRVHLLIFRWEVFRVMPKSFPKKDIIRFIEQGRSTKRERGIFPAFWLKEVFINKNAPAGVSGPGGAGL